MAKTKLRETKITECLRSWRHANGVIKTLTEEELAVCLDRELKAHKRREMAIRLHARLGVLRTARERSEMLKKL